MRAVSLLPLLGLGALVAFLFAGLWLDPREVPSPLIDKPAPAFDLAQLHKPELRITDKDLHGTVTLVNVWASWCVSCRVEHPLLVDLAKATDLNIVGLNYKDEPDAARQWLLRLGDPYTRSMMDRDGRVGIDWGVYGVPETFVVDAKGIIRHKHIGPLSPDALMKKILPLVRRLREGG
jgi:cytochrome c biogenesis protein CcmG, thiol:disulfide interchange protein DsbE